jgi:PTS system mannose-specific IIC component
MLTTLLLCSALAGLLATDVLVALQLMLSRPLVAATLTGALLGEPGAGLSLGCLMELIWAGALPVGSVVPPDFSLGSVFAAAASVMMHRANPGLDWESCVVWALLWSLPLSWAFGHADQWQRRWHLGLVARAEEALEAGDEGGLGRAIFSSVAMSFARGFVLCALALALCVRPMGFILGRVFDAAHEALDWMYWLGLMLGFVVLLDIFWERRWLRASALSFAASAAAYYGLKLHGSTVLAAAAATALLSATVFERRMRA